jgi:hypothetical protein
MGAQGAPYIAITLARDVECDSPIQTAGLRLGHSDAPRVDILLCPLENSHPWRWPVCAPVKKQRTGPTGYFSW